MNCTFEINSCNQFPFPYKLYLSQFTATLPKFYLKIVYQGEFFFSLNTSHTHLMWWNYVCIKLDISKPDLQHKIPALPWTWHKQKLVLVDACRAEHLPCKVDRNFGFPPLEGSSMVDWMRKPTDEVTKCI